MNNVLDCDIVGCDFKLQLCLCLVFRPNTIDKDNNFIILPSLGKIVKLFFFENDDTGIK